MGISIVVTSGKGGTGKTSLVCGVGSCLAAMNYRVLLIDMDVGLRDLDLALGMTDRVLMDFSDVIYKRCTLEEAAVEHPKIENLYLLTAPVTARPGQFDQLDMLTLLSKAREQFDYVFLDGPAGIGSGFDLSIAGADRAIVVSTTDAICLRNAQRTVSLLQKQQIPIHLVVNKMSRRMLRKLHTNIDDAMDAAGLPLLGIVPEDEKVPICSGLGEPIILHARKGAAIGFYNIARRLTGMRVPIHRFR